MNRPKAAITAAAAALFLCNQAFALVIPGRTETKVNDYANVLDQATRSELESTLQEFELKSPRKIEFIVSTFRALDGMPFETFINSYAHQWRRPWPFERDMRVHFIVVVGDRKVRVGVGRPLRSDLTEDEVYRILKAEVTPRFSRGEYGEGILVGTRAMIRELGDAK